MKNYLKIGLVTIVLMSTVSLAACEKKKPDVKQLSVTEVVAKKQPSALTLEQRVSALEQRNREVDAAVRRKRLAASKGAQ